MRTPPAELLGLVLVRLRVRARPPGRCRRGWSTPARRRRSRAARTWADALDRLGALPARRVGAVAVGLRDRPRRRPAECSRIDSTALDGCACTAFDVRRGRLPRRRAPGRAYCVPPPPPCVLVGRAGRSSAALPAVGVGAVAVGLLDVAVVTRAVDADADHVVARVVLLRVRVRPGRPGPCRRTARRPGHRRPRRSPAWSPCSVAASLPALGASVLSFDWSTAPSVPRAVDADADDVVGRVHLHAVRGRRRALAGARRDWSADCTPEPPAPDRPTLAGLAPALPATAFDAVGVRLVTAPLCSGTADPDVDDAVRRVGLLRVRARRRRLRPSTPTGPAACTAGDSASALPAARASRSTTLASSTSTGFLQRLPLVRWSSDRPRVRPARRCRLLRPPRRASRVGRAPRTTGSPGGPSAARRSPGNLMGQGW